jgi:hypothetical protein
MKKVEEQGSELSRMLYRSSVDDIYSTYYSRRELQFDHLQLVLVQPSNWFARLKVKEKPCMKFSARQPSQMIINLDSWHALSDEYYKHWLFYEQKMT